MTYTCAFCGRKCSDVTLMVLHAPNGVTCTECTFMYSSRYHYWGLRNGHVGCIQRFSRKYFREITLKVSDAFHRQGVLSCAWLKLLVVAHRYFSCAWSVCVCVHGTTHTHTHTHTPQVQNYAAKHRPSTRKISVSHHE